MPFIGVLSGFLAGLFGVGGGLITVPLLVFIGVPIKFAVGISTMQMLASSYFGTYINNKTTTIRLREYLYLGLGGLIGGVIGGHLLHLIDDKTLGFIFSSVLAFAILKIYFTPHKEENLQKISKPLMVVMGVLIGVMSSVLGVGGTVVLIPLLVGFFGYNTKTSAIVALFFVTFTSTSSFLTLYFLGYVDITKGAIVALFSMIGVKIGIWTVDKVSTAFHKNLVVMLYLALLGIFIEGMS